MKILVTGGAGCIGSVLLKKLLEDGHDIVVFDNFSSGKKEHIEDIMGNIRLVDGDILDIDKLRQAIEDVDTVFHLAANADVKYQVGMPTDKDIMQNTMGTYNILEAMRKKNVNKILFSSTSAVYGEAGKEKITENHAPMNPISLYGASKLACEALISAYSHMFGMQSWIFRFGNVVGPQTRVKGTTVLHDFIRKLKKNPMELEILGNGQQKKSYIYVDDCVKGMLAGFSRAKGRLNIFNLSSDDNITVNEIAEIVVSKLGLKGVRFTYTGGDRGWIGDVPIFSLDISKIKGLGWRPERNSRQAIEHTLDQIIEVI